MIFLKKPLELLHGSNVTFFVLLLTCLNTVTCCNMALENNITLFTDIKTK